MKCDTDLIINILYKVKSYETKTIESFVFHCGVQPNGPCVEFKFDNKQEFVKIYANILCIDDYSLADVRVLQKGLAIAINHITPKGSDFLVKARILQAIDKGTSNERDIATTLELQPYTVNVHLKQLIDRDFLHGSKAFKDGEHEYKSCALKSKGKAALEDPSYLLEESNMANNTNNFNAPVGSFDNKGTQTNVTGVVEGDQIGTQYNSPQEKTLAEAAKEIQKLLQQLDSSATEEAKIAYVNDETSTGFKRRVVAALKAMGDTAIEEFVQRPEIKVVASGVKAWVLPE